jgi:hypothetical protein
VENDDLSNGTPIPFCIRLWQLLPRSKEAGQGSQPRSKGVVASLPPPLLHCRAAPGMKAFRPIIRVLVINDNHYGLTFLFEL